MNKKLHESQTPRKGKALLISEGVGSSGTYSAELLQRDGASAFPAGTHIFANHLGNEEAWERNGSRDIRDIIGVTTEAASWDETDRGLTSGIEIFPHARDFVESVWEHVGLSVEASGVVSEDGVVEALMYSPLNAVALVPVAGRGGKVQGLFESFRESYGSITNDESTKKEEPGMTPEEITSVAEALAEALKPSLTAIHEALTPAEPIVKDEEGEDASVIAEALVASELPTSARTKVYEAVKTGVPVADAIATEKTYITELLAESKTDGEFNGRVDVSGTGAPKSALKAWG